MRIVFFFLIVLVICSLCACQPGNESSPKANNITAVSSKSTAYAKHGISFSIPDGWKQMESPIPGEQGEAIGAYIMVEKQGEDESGQFIASLLDTKIPLKEYMDLVQNQLLQSLSVQQSNVNFSEVKEENFNGAKALACKFDHNALDLNFKGELKAFYCGGKTVQIFIQEEKSDATKNKPGLDLLVGSFKCE